MCRMALTRPLRISFINVSFRQAKILLEIPPNVRYLRYWKNHSTLALQLCLLQININQQFPIFATYHRSHPRQPYAKRTIDAAYIHWMKFFINFHNKQHPAQLNDSDVEAFLNFLINKRKVAAQTQASVLNALSFCIK